MRFPNPDNPILTRERMFFGWQEWETFLLHKEDLLRSGYTFIAIWEDQVVGYYRSYTDYRNERHSLKALGDPRWNTECFSADEDNKSFLVSSNDEWDFQDYMLDGENYL